MTSSTACISAAIGSAGTGTWVKGAFTTVGAGAKQAL